MRIAFSTLGCPDWSLEQAIREAQAHGYEGIEVRLLDGEVITPELVAANRSRIRSAFDNSTLSLVALASSVRLTWAVSDERDASVSTAAKLITEAQALGCPMIRVFGGRIPEGISPADGVQRAAETLQTIAPLAESAGVRIVLETHDDFSSSERVAEVLEQVPSPAVGALWDVHHPYRMGEPLPTVWTRLADRLYHVHVKDARRLDEEKWQLVLLGEGEVPVREVVRALAMRGYDGWISVEWEKKWHPEIPDPEIALPQHIERLRTYLSE